MKEKQYKCTKCGKQVTMSLKLKRLVGRKVLCVDCNEKAMHKYYEQEALK